MDHQIHTLIEMGFTQDQAIDALGSCGNDLTKAIAYLFGEVEEPKGTGTQASPYIVDSMPVDSYESVHVNNPQDLPEFLGQYASSEAMEPMSMSDHYPSVSYDYERYTDSKTERPASTDSLGSSMDAVAEIEDASEPDYGPNVKTEGNLFPTVVVRSSNQKYWVALINILARFTPFAEALLAEENPSPFVEELQRLVYFITNFRHSSRWYVSADELLAALPSDFGGDDYFGDEVILNAYSQIMLEQLLLRPVFESLVESVEEDISKDLTVLEIDSDTRRNNLYRTLNELFWEKGFVKLGLIKYKRVAPLVTYQLIGDSSSYAPPLELQEVVYPEVYSEKAQQAVEHEVHLMRQAETSLQAVSRKLMDLNVFEGKRISSLLRQATAAVGRTACDDPAISDARDDLAQLTEKLDEVRMSEIETQNNLRRQAAGEQLGNYREIAAQCNLQPYHLMGAIISETHFYVRLDVDSYLRMDEQLVVDFDDVAASVALATRQDSHLVTLIYGVSDGCPHEFEESAEEGLIDLGQNDEDSEGQVRADDTKEEQNGNDAQDAVDGAALTPKLANAVSPSEAARSCASAHEQPLPTPNLGLGDTTSGPAGWRTRAPKVEMAEHAPGGTGENLEKDTTLEGGDVHSAQSNPPMPHQVAHRDSCESLLSDLSTNQAGNVPKQGALQGSGADIEAPRLPLESSRLQCASRGRVAQRVIEQFHADEQNALARWL